LFSEGGDEHFIQDAEIDVLLRCREHKFEQFSLRSPYVSMLSAGYRSV
jgi:hypothetical protein